MAGREQRVTRLLRTAHGMSLKKNAVGGKSVRQQAAKRSPRRFTNVKKEKWSGYLGAHAIGVRLLDRGGLTKRLHRNRNRRHRQLPVTCSREWIKQRLRSRSGTNASGIAC